MQKVHTISADVGSETVRDELEQGLDGFPPVDVLVNSAGVSHSGAFLDTPPQTFDVSVGVLMCVKGIVINLDTLLGKNVCRLNTS